MNSFAIVIYRWLHERIDLVSLRDALVTRLIPVGVGFWYTLGFASLFVFINQMVTGMVLALYYSPSPEHAYDSVNYIMNEVTFGSVIRGLHHWGSSAMVVLVLAHGVVVFAMAAYKYPRELTWIIGVLMFLVVLGFSFTGYLLPWDEKAYWATTVGTNMAGTVPYIGDYLVKALRGGSTLGTMTLARFYVAHTMILPAILLLLIGIHLFLVVRIGVSVPPKLWEGGRQPRSVARGRRF